LVLSLQKKEEVPTTSAEESRTRQNAFSHFRAQI